MPDNEKKWKALYWNAMRNKGGDVTFNQLYSQFGYKVAVEQGSRERPAFHRSYYPPRDLSLMPKNVNDWHRTVAKVNASALRKD